MMKNKYLNNKLVFILGVCFLLICMFVAIPKKAQAQPACNYGLGGSCEVTCPNGTGSAGIQDCPQIGGGISEQCCVAFQYDCDSGTGPGYCNSPNQQCILTNGYFYSCQTTCNGTCFSGNGCPGGYSQSGSCALRTSQNSPLIQRTCCVANGGGPTPPPTCNGQTVCGGWVNPGANTTCAGNNSHRNCTTTFTNCTQSSFTQYRTVNSCTAGHTCYTDGTCHLTNCTTGEVNCGACGGGTQPANTCNNTNSNPGGRTCHHNGPAGCLNQVTFRATDCSYSYNTCNNTYTCPAGSTGHTNCTTTLTVRLFIDYNHNGVKDGEDPYYTAANVSVRLAWNGGSNTSAFDNTGTHTFTVQSNNYTLSLVGVPGNYRIISRNPYPIGMGPAATVNLAITPLYSISGTVYDDTNKNKIFDPNCGNPNPSLCDHGVNQGGVTMVFKDDGSKTTAAINGDGTFNSGTTLESGTYTVNYTLPNGNEWEMSYPIPATLIIDVGKPGTSRPCNDGTYNDVACDGTGNITGADFGITNEYPSHVGICTDQRDDNGFTDPLPQPPGSTAACGNYSLNGTSYPLVMSYADICPTNAGTGIIFSGNQDPFFGQGAASKTNWSVGNTTYPENYTPAQPGVITTSYDYLVGLAQSSGIDFTNPSNELITYCDLNNCTLPSNLPNGVYFADGDVNLNAYTFPSNKEYVILVNGNLTINGNILLPTGSDAIFAVSGNIIIPPTVGETDPTSSDADIEGLYSAGGSVLIESAATPIQPCNNDASAIDKRLNIYGSMNANTKQVGGSVQNQRDLCVSDVICPTYMVSIGDGNPDGNRVGAGTGVSYILNAPQFIMHKNYFYQEVNP